MLFLLFCFNHEVSCRLETPFYLLRRWNIETNSLQKMLNLLPWECLNQVRKISSREEQRTFCPGTEGLSNLPHFIVLALPQSPFLFKSTTFKENVALSLFFSTQPSLAKAEEADVIHSLYITPFYAWFKGAAVHYKLFLDFTHYCTFILFTGT